MLHLSRLSISKILNPAPWAVLMTNNTNSIEQSLKELISKKNYPCIAAIQSLTQHEYKIGVYKGFGTGISAEQLGRDLNAFKQQQKATDSIYLSFFAVFDDLEFESEKAFEEAMWRELSFLSAKDAPGTPWDSHFSDDPKDKNFCFSFGGEAFFIVGLHPKSSRLARQFPYPTLVFNLYEQFEELHRRGQYYPMIKTNRQRDLKFQGSINPMVETHSDIWESIQFSGRANPPTWECPFKHDLKS